jgi:hypothetical protein
VTRRPVEANGCLNTDVNIDGGDQALRAAAHYTASRLNKKNLILNLINTNIYYFDTQGFDSLIWSLILLNFIIYFDLFYVRFFQSYNPSLTS